MFEKPAYEDLNDLKIVENKKKLKYADSLNEYLDNSDEQENNYETHLKFRKKALERELQYELDKNATDSNTKLKDNND